MRDRIQGVRESVQAGGRVGSRERDVELGVVSVEVVRTGSVGKEVGEGGCIEGEKEWSKNRALGDAGGERASWGEDAAHKD